MAVALAHPSSGACLQESCTQERPQVRAGARGQAGPAQPHPPEAQPPHPARLAPLQQPTGRARLPRHGPAPPGGPSGDHRATILRRQRLGQVKSRACIPRRLRSRRDQGCRQAGRRQVHHRGRRHPARRGGGTRRGPVAATNARCRADGDPAVERVMSIARARRARHRRRVGPLLLQRGWCRCVRRA